MARKITFKSAVRAPRAKYNRVGVAHETRVTLTLSAEDAVQLRSALRTAIDEVYAARVALRPGQAPHRWDAILAALLNARDRELLDLTV